MAETLLEIVRQERARAAAAEASLDEQVKSKLGVAGYTAEFGPESPTGCTPVLVTGPSGQVASAWLCLGRTRRRRCDFCDDNWSSTRCDYPTGGACPRCKGRGKQVRSGKPCGACVGTGYRMCNQPICSRCSAHRDPDEDFCPDHREVAGFAPLVRREVCAWTTRAAGLIRRNCLHQGCPRLLQYGQRVLYFGRRRRAMCAACGARYLEISI